MYDSNSINTLFSGLNTTTNTTGYSGNMGINLADYASIKNGSYSKLMKSYYSLDETEEAKSKETNSKNDTKDTDITLRSIKSASEELKESTKALYSNKALFEKNEKGEYDMEAIYEKVNDFIEAYNGTVESTGKAETESIARAGASLVNAVSENKDMLDKLGISVSGADFTLSIDKTKFMEAKISDVKSMFNGMGSFAYQVGSKASRIYNMVEDKVSGTGAYGAAKPDTSSSTSKDTASTIAKIKDRADDFVATGTELYKNRALFDKNYGGEYDMEEILENIGGFVKNYNDLLISAENTKSSGVESAVKAMKDITKAYTKELSALGITIADDDDTLLFDEKVFGNADMSKAEKLFTGTGTFAYQVTVKAAMVANQAETEANKANTYTDNATFANNYNTGSIFNGMV